METESESVTRVCNSLQNITNNKNIIATITTTTNNKNNNKNSNHNDNNGNSRSNSSTNSTNTTTNSSSVDSSHGNTLLQAATVRGEVLKRVFTPTCPKCAVQFPAPHRSLPPKRWKCPTKGCGGKLWQPDVATNMCDVCAVVVTKFSRHHCRRCGYITCGRCLTLHTIFPEWSKRERQRICRRCSVPEVPVAVSGWLLRLGQRSSLFSEKRQMRYFELRGTILLYGKGASHPKSLGMFSSAQHFSANTSSFVHVTASEDVSYTNSPFPAPTLTGLVDIIGGKVVDMAIYPHAFCIIGPRLPRGYVLSASCAEEKTRWVSAIREQVEQARVQHGADQLVHHVDPCGKLIYTSSGSVEDNLKVSIQDFELLNVIGIGSFGRVMRVRYKVTGMIYAMKVLKKQHIIQHNMITHTNTEKLILSEISHPFVVRLYYAFQTKHHLILVMDFLCGGELFFHLQRCRRFDESRARFYAAEIGSALEYIHSKHMLYRDLKPENLLLDGDGHVMLTDFGLAKHLFSRHTRTHTFCGTPEYMAPELVQKIGHTMAADWWSLGVFLYEMVAGTPPFYSENKAEMYEMILHQPLVCPLSFSPELRALLARLLEKDPAKRLCSGAEFRADPFFKSINFEKLLRREITPTFVPNVRRGELRYFDKRFLQESTHVSQLNQPCDMRDSMSLLFKDYEYDVDLCAAAATRRQKEREDTVEL